MLAYCESECESDGGDWTSLLTTLKLFTITYNAQQLVLILWTYMADGGTRLYRKGSHSSTDWKSRAKSTLVSTWVYYHVTRILTYTEQ